MVSWLIQQQQIWLLQQDLAQAHAHLPAAAALTYLSHQHEAARPWDCLQQLSDTEEFAPGLAVTLTSHSEMLVEQCTHESLVKCARECQSHHVACLKHRTHTEGPP